MWRVCGAERDLELWREAYECAWRFVLERRENTNGRESEYTEGRVCVSVVARVNETGRFNTQSGKLATRVAESRSV